MKQTTLRKLAQSAATLGADFLAGHLWNKRM